ncbi:MAG: CocE/NonD family hydrolase [Thermoleophilaceae bacterium]
MDSCLRAAAAALAVLVIGATPAVAAGPPKDYTQTANLSQPVFSGDEIVREIFEVPMHDGVHMYVEVVRPAADGDYPVILEASPYHGTLADRDGRRILPEPAGEDGVPLGLTGYFAPRGYAVVMADLRGTGRSEGCLDHLGQNDAKDLKDIVEWAASADWSNGRVGMTGHSYVGSTPSVAAAQNPAGLVTILPSAGLSSMYDHQFQAGVPYFLQWAGPMEAYEQLALQRHLPPAPADPLGLVGPTGDSFGKGMEYFGCGLPNSSLVEGERQFSGEYGGWHAERDHDAGATAADIPVFLWHGVNDNAARVSSMEWFTRRDGHPGDKLWLGQWDHGSGCCPTRRGIQATYAMHAWFDKHLAQRDTDTGPPVEMFLSDGTFEEATTGDRDQIHTADAWPGAPRALGLNPSASGGTLEPGEVEEGEASFIGDPLGVVDPQGTGGVDFVSEPVEADTLFAGQPRLELAASVSAPRVHLIANVYDESPDGDRRRLSQCAINPELRNGIATNTPVVPGERYDMTPSCYAMAHNLRAGHRLVLRVTASDPDKVPIFALDPNITVFTGPGATALQLPVVDGPTLYEDDIPLEEGAGVPVGPAQAPLSGSAMPLAPGAGVRVEPLTSATFEFDVEDGFDNARMVASAVPGAPADIDLYLQRQEDDGTWSDDLASGASGSLESETLESGRLEPGHYRIEVHNWAGPPATSVELSLTFFNQDGEPGA